MAAPTPEPPPQPQPLRADGPARSPLGRRVGVLGGGQLGRMLLPPAQALGLHLAYLDPDPEAPVAGLTPHVTLGHYADAEAVLAFGRSCDVLTIEIEHVAVDALRTLAAQGVAVYPPPDVIALVQDKGLQKQFYQQHGFPTADFRLVESGQQLRRSATQFPLMLKLRRGGYDGRGVMRLASAADLDRAFDAPCVVEQLVDIRQEIAVIVARSTTGQTLAYPPVEMAFHPTAHLVDFLFAPARLDRDTHRQAQLLAVRLAEALGTVGLLAVELFVTTSGQLLINEIAPRPHNSGHATIEANVTSQYAQHLRAILGLPLGSTRLVEACAMVNLVGAEGHSGPARLEGLERVLATPGAHLHWYGKAHTRPYRKMGHVTLTDPDLEAAIQKAYLVRQTLRVVT